MSNDGKEVRIFAAIRHGRTSDPNEDSPLSERGVIQVRSFVPALLNFVLREGERGLLVAASHIRTAQTGELINELSGGRLDYVVSGDLNSDEIYDINFAGTLGAIANLVNGHAAVLAVTSGRITNDLVMNIQPNGNARFAPTVIENASALVAEGDCDTYYVRWNGVTTITPDMAEE